MQKFLALSFVAGVAAQDAAACTDPAGAITPLENLMYGFGNMPAIEAGAEVDIMALMADPDFGPWAMANMGCLGCAGGAAGLARLRRRLQDDGSVSEFEVGVTVLGCAGITALTAEEIAALTAPPCDAAALTAVVGAASGRRLQMEGLTSMFTQVQSLGNECSSCYLGAAMSMDAMGQPDADDAAMALGMTNMNGCFGAEAVGAMMAAQQAGAIAAAEAAAAAAAEAAAADAAAAAEAAAAADQAADVAEAVEEAVEEAMEEVSEEIQEALEQIEEGDGSGAAAGSIVVATALVAAAFAF